MNGVFTQAPSQIAHRFTSASAREMSLRSWQKRRERKANPVNVPQTAPVEAERSALVREQIDLVRTQLCKKGIEPNERANLIRALDLLLDRERELAGIPKAGNRRPGPERSQRRWAVEPAEPLPTAAQPFSDAPGATPACGVDTPSNSVPKPSSDGPTPQETQPPKP